MLASIRKRLNGAVVIVVVAATSITPQHELIAVRCDGPRIDAQRLGFGGDDLRVPDAMVHPLRASS